MEGSCSVMITDAHDMFRDTLAMSLKIFPLLNIIGEFKCGITAIEHSKELKPDIMFYDTELLDINPFEAVHLIKKDSPNTKIIGICCNVRPTYVHKMVMEGASGFVTKTSELKTFHEAILYVLKGEIYICEEILSKNKDLLKLHRRRA